MTELEWFNKVSYIMVNLRSEEKEVIIRNKRVHITLNDVSNDVQMIELAHEIPISQMIVKSEIAREINVAVMKIALKMMEEEERRRGEYL